MMVYFLADLHLNIRRPQRLDEFYRFLAEHAADATTTYILGDLFDLCLGDDDDRPPNDAIKAALLRAAEDGANIAIMHGNHDFTMGAAFERQTGCRLLADPTLVELDGRRVLLMHGDTLCTDDREYQAYRAEIRSPRGLEQLLSLSLEERLARAKEISRISQQRVKLKSVEIMDVNPDAVGSVVAEYNADILIHGHTHRPGTHNARIGGREIRRLVLAPWFERSSILAWRDGQPDFNNVDEL